MIVERLKYTRERKNIKQRELASLFGVDYSTVSGWETGKDTIPLKYLIIYANTYNYSLDYLYGLTTENKQYEKLEIDLEKIGNNLKKLRKSHGYTLKELTKKLNYSISCYSHYEKGRTLISTNFLYALTTIYEKISLDELLGRKKKVHEKIPV